MTDFNERFSTRTAFEKRSIFQRIYVNSHKEIQLFLAVNLEASQVFPVQTKALLYSLAWHPEFQNQYIRGRKTLSIISMSTLNENQYTTINSGRNR